MPFSLATELWAAACATLFGVLLGVCYDAVRVFRILLGLPAGRALPARLSGLCFPYVHIGGKGKEGRIGRRLYAAILFLTDFLYAAMAGIAFVIFLYATHDGAFRFFLLFFSALGFASYLFTLGRLVYRVTGVIAFFLRVAFAYLILCVRVPLLFLLRVLAFFLRLLLAALLRALSSLLTPLIQRLTLARRLDALRGLLRAPLG